MNQEPLNKFNWFLGEWDLEYDIPATSFCRAMTDVGSGTIKKMLNDNYVIFEYSTQETAAEAKGIFGWDEKLQTYRYWWFENSGNYLTATCHFINDDILFVNWNDTPLIQTFTRETPERILLTMEHPDENGISQRIMTVIMRKKA